MLFIHLFIFLGGKSRQDDDLEKRKREVDEEKYPEFYRKTVRVKGSNETISKPFGIGIITQVREIGIFV